MLLETEWISEIIEFIFFSADEVIARPTVTTAATTFNTEGHKVTDGKVPLCLHSLCTRCQKWIILVYELKKRRCISCESPYRSSYTVMRCRYSASDMSSLCMLSNMLSHRFEDYGKKSMPVTRKMQETKVPQ